MMARGKGERMGGGGQGAKPRALSAPLFALICVGPAGVNAH